MQQEKFSVTVLMNDGRTTTYTVNAESRFKAITEAQDLIGSSGIVLNASLFDDS